jgi:hypothetical protein
MNSLSVCVLDSHTCVGLGAQVKHLVARELAAQEEEGHLHTLYIHTCVCVCVCVCACVCVCVCVCVGVCMASVVRSR